MHHPKGPWVVFCPSTENMEDFKDAASAIAYCESERKQYPDMSIYLLHLEREWRGPDSD